MANKIKVEEQAPDFTLPDKDMKPLSSFSEKNRLPFPILSDNKHEVFEQYGLQFSPCNKNLYCFESGFYPIVKRSILILDGKGVVRYRWVSNKSMIDPSYAEIQKVLEHLSCIKAYL